ncbi:DUF2931 family protein [Pedobacter ureilyticus]|uniref:DUF2931 family protein n=1 Tax=Pedobacter ureilyticus TaxID=1393051 RepID=A0ABW9J4Y1_9SPHI|nr:DUF2931 family protein [Pedobacter helvus]
MKLNLVNKIYIGIAIILLLSIALRVFNYKAWDRHYFFASVSAPYTHPIYLRDIYFIYPNEDDFGGGFSYSRDEVNNFNSSWGAEYYSPRVGDPLQFPKQLALQYVSYRDKKFYKDTLDLPRQTIEDIFRQAKDKNQLLNISSNKVMDEKQGLHFVVGIANDGNVIVWLRGMYFEKVLLKTKLKPKELSSEDLYYVKPLNKKEYYQKVFEYMPDTIKNLINSGVDAKANYIDTPTHYIEQNKDYWENQKKAKL